LQEFGGGNIFAIRDEEGLVGGVGVVDAGAS
jgi:hypothetical protein